MYSKKRAFTLIEVLISISLLSLILLTLYKSLNTLRDSNIQLFRHLEEASVQKRVTETLFLDIAGSDGNITIEGDEFSRLCLNNSINSLYGLTSAKICWVVAKKNNTLMRSEGNNYKLPLNSDDRVAVDATIDSIDLFRVYKNKNEVLVLLQQKGKSSISFVVYGVSKKIKKKIKKVKKAPKKAPKRPNPNTTSPPTNPLAQPPKNSLDIPTAPVSE